MDFLDTLLQLRLGFVYLNNIEKSLQCATKLIENRGCFSLIDVYIYIWKGVVKISVSSPCFRVIHTEECRRARGACEDVKIYWSSQEDGSFSQRFQLTGIKVRRYFC